MTDQIVEYGFCHCGCGELTTISRQNHVKFGWVKGQPKKFIRGHGHAKGGYTTSEGYKCIRVPNHPRSSTNGYVKEHILIAEKALGKPLPPKAVCHHFKGMSNNRGNLVVCQDQAYHIFLHVRTLSYRECGNAFWRKCWICQKYDNPSNLSLTGTPHHITCQSNYYMKRRQDDNRTSSSIV